MNFKISVEKAQKLSRAGEEKNKHLAAIKRQAVIEHIEELVEISANKGLYTTDYFSADDSIIAELKSWGYNIIYQQTMIDKIQNPSNIRISWYPDGEMENIRATVF